MFANFKTLFRLLTDADFRRRRRESARLHGLPRYQLTTTTLFGKTLKLPDAASYLSTVSEVIEREIYRFACSEPAPRIIDGGANIGLSVIYFKRIFPNARVTAFEPDPAIYRILSANLASFGFDDVELIDKALWKSECELSFWSEGADAGRLGEAVFPDRRRTVSTVRLRDYLTDHVDLLKLDVEGAETEILRDCADRLGNVERVFVEYHSFSDRSQTLHTLTGILADAGFRLHLTPVMTSPQPFWDLRTQLGMDNQLNIYGVRRCTS